MSDMPMEMRYPGGGRTEDAFGRDEEEAAHR